MVNIKHKTEWSILIICFSLLIWFYKTDLKELIKIVLQWTFATTAFFLLIERGFKHDI